MAFNLDTCARANILKLEPYRYDGTNVLLDANENAFGPSLDLDDTDSDLSGLHRYPDPHQEELKQLLCNLRHDPTHIAPGASPLSPANLFVGVGSDEAIDSLIRCFCVPSKDKILICPPTYGMYTVSSCVNDVEIVKVPQIPSSSSPAPFKLDIEGIEKALSDNVKIIFLCSPGNPTAQRIEKQDIDRLLRHPTYNGIVVVDEAYVDFSPPHSSFASAVTSYPNLVVMQTLSKAFGLAGIRLGAAFADARVAGLLNSMKAPYNIPSPTSQLAIRALQENSLKVMRDHLQSIVAQRERMIHKLQQIPGIGRFKGGFDANFVLVEILDNGKPSNPLALKVYEQLAAQLGVVVRFRGKEHGCEGCLRITVGTSDEVTRMLSCLHQALQSGTSKVDVKAEEKASAVVA